MSIDMSVTLENARSTGSRRLTATMLAVRDRADQFKGIPRASAKRFKFLAAFQQAEPYLGLPPQAYKLISWLVKQTLELDWEEGSRPIAWPGVRVQAEFLALSVPRVKMLNRALFEAGIFVMRDSETGKRYGRRVHPKGQIIEAYGFDLSPLAYRYDEFIRIAAEAKAERDRMRSLRKRATCARRAITQVGETLTALGSLPSQWHRLALETADLVKKIQDARSSGSLAMIVMGLETRKDQAEAWLRETAQPVNSNPVGLVNEPHNITTNPSFDPKDTVRLGEKSSPGGESISQPSTPADTSYDDSADTVTFRPFERLEKLHPKELLDLAPRLAEHVQQQYPNWSDVCAAAQAHLRQDLGISQPLWGEACLKLGPVIATVALAIVSTKPKEHFARGAGGYFAAMVKRAKTGELHLDRSLWKLRRDKWGTRHVN